MASTEPALPIDLAVLTRIVRVYFQDDDLALGRWETRPLSYGRVVGTTAGVFHIDGEAVIAGAIRRWAMVIKIIAASDTATASEWHYGGREALVYQHTVLHALTGRLVPPRCYGVTSGPNDATWLWLEAIATDEPSRWTIASYEYAAHGLGECAALLQPQPDRMHDAPLTYPFAASWCNNWFPWYDPASDDAVWAHPAVRRFVSERQRTQVLQFRAEAEGLIARYQQLPQTFCHHDTHRLNLIIQHHPKPFARIVAIDWALAGPGPIGADAADLVSGSLLNFCFDMHDAEQLESRVLRCYLDGLAEARWQGDTRQVELGYLLQTVLRFETLLPGWIAIWLDEQEVDATQRRYDLTEAQIAATWVALLDFAIERHARLSHLLAAR